MSEAYKNFTFDSDEESFVANEGNGFITMEYDGSIGYTAGSLKFYIQRKNITAQSYWEWRGTWGDLNVPSGGLVDSIQLTSGHNRMTLEPVPIDSYTFGPYELWSDTPAKLGDLWPTGRVVYDPESDYTISSQSALDVSSQGYNDTDYVRIRLYNSVDTSSTTDSGCTCYDDDLSFTIVYHTGTTQWGAAAITDCQTSVTTDAYKVQYAACNINNPATSVTVAGKRVCYGDSDISDAEASVSVWGCRVQSGQAAIDGYITVDATGTKVLIAACAIDAITSIMAHANVPLLSNYLEDELLDHLLGTTQFTMPTGLYLSLHNGSPGETGANELSGNGYARASVSFNDASGGAADNDAQVTFPQVTTSEWQVTNWGLWDASSGGNFFLSGPLLAATIPVGNVAALAAGAVRVVLD